jgi:hypothetical protein
MVRTHLQEASIVLPTLADEDRVDRLFIARLLNHCDGGARQRGRLRPALSRRWSSSSAEQSSFCEAIRQGIRMLRVRVGQVDGNTVLAHCHYVLWSLLNERHIQSR